MASTNFNMSHLYEKNDQSNLEKRITQLEAELYLKNAIIQGLDLRCRHVEQRLNSVYASLSWRLTSPLRRLGDLIGNKTGLYINASNSGDDSIPVNPYMEWIEKYDLLDENDRAAIVRHIDCLPQKPLISVLLPVFNTPELWLRRAIDSVVNQLYDNWELCIADDASSDTHVRKLLEEFSALDNRIKIIFREENGHISAATNSALTLATGDYVALLDHDDELAEHALYLVATEINRFPDADIIYSDEDKLDTDGKRCEPYFKPDWNPELLVSQNYISHFGVYRKSLVTAIGGFRVGYEGSQDYDLALRCIDQSRSGVIRHIPHILYHWRVSEGSTAAAERAKNYVEKSALLALKDYLASNSPGSTVSIGKWPTTYKVVYPLPERLPLVSLIIPTRDGYKVLRQCVESILAKTDYPNFELIIVDNQSSDRQTLRYLAGLGQHAKVRVLSYSKPFNYSSINNFAVREASGSIVGLINNDLEVISPAWLSEMVRHAIRPEVGAVGAKLYYPDDRVQHAGVVLGIRGVAGHSHLNCERTEPGMNCRLFLVQNFSAVTAACLLIRKEVFEQVEGLDEDNLAVAFNDIDFCLRVQEAGYRNVWTPYAELYHHESYSRGYENTPEKQMRFSREIAYMQERWGALLYADPYYNPNLSLDHADFSLAWPPRVVKPWKTAVPARLDGVLAPDRQN